MTLHRPYYNASAASSGQFALQQEAIDRINASTKKIEDWIKRAKERLEQADALIEEAHKIEGNPHAWVDWEKKRSKYRTARFMDSREDDDHT